MTCEVLPGSPLRVAKKRQSDCMTQHNSWHRDYALAGKHVVFGWQGPGKWCNHSCYRTLPWLGTCHTVIALTAARSMEGLPSVGKWCNFINHCSCYETLPQLGMCHSALTPAHSSWLWLRHRALTPALSYVGTVFSREVLELYKPPVLLQNFASAWDDSHCIDTRA